MTGRAAGYCAGFGRPGYAGSRFGYGRGRGFGLGSGRGAWGRGGGGFFAGRFGWPPNAAQSLDEVEEKRILKNQMESLDLEMSAIRRRLAEIEEAEKAGAEETK